VALLVEGPDDVVVLVVVEAEGEAVGVRELDQVAGGVVLVEGGEAAGVGARAQPVGEIVEVGAAIVRPKPSGS
jgi:hypothetical protein